MRFQIQEAEGRAGWLVIDGEDETAVTWVVSERPVAVSFAELFEQIAELRAQFETLSTTVVHLQNGTPVYQR